MLNSNICKHFTVCQQIRNTDRIISVKYQYWKPFNCVQKKRSDSFKNLISKMCSCIIYLLNMYEED